MTPDLHSYYCRTLRHIRQALANHGDDPGAAEILVRERKRTLRLIKRIRIAERYGWAGEEGAIPYRARWKYIEPTFSDACASLTHAEVYEGCYASEIAFQTGSPCSTQSGGFHKDTRGRNVR